MTSASMQERQARPALLCYDGSPSAGRAIERAGVVLGGGSAVVLTVWEAVEAAVMHHPVLDRSESVRESREDSRELVDAFEAEAAGWARATAAEGTELANAAGFGARARPHRARARPSERSEGTVWRAVLSVADEERSSVVVLGSRGRSGIKAALLGTVSYAVVHNARRPVLIVPTGGAPGPDPAPH